MLYFLSSNTYLGTFLSIIANQNTSQLAASRHNLYYFNHILIIIHVTDDSFEADVLKAEGPVLVDFWAEWCGPCKMIAPVLDELANTYAGKISIAKMDVDDSKETPAKFNIRGIPTLIIFKNGEASSTKVGALTKKQLIEFIESSL